MVQYVDIWFTTEEMCGQSLKKTISGKHPVRTKAKYVLMTGQMTLLLHPVISHQVVGKNLEGLMSFKCCDELPNRTGQARNRPVGPVSYRTGPVW